MSSSLSLPSTPVLSPIHGQPNIPSFRELSRNDPPSPPRAPPPSPSRKHYGICEYSRPDPPSPPHAPPPSPQRRPEFSAAFSELNNNLYEMSRGGMQELSLSFDNAFGGELPQEHNAKCRAKRVRSNGDSEDDIFGSNKPRNNFFVDEQLESAFLSDGFEEDLNWSYTSKFGSRGRAFRPL